jgi:hypothetical protein
VIASLGFAKRKASHIDLYDTQARDLSAQGVTIRIRHGAVNDLTVKLRSAVGEHRAGDPAALDQFPCEIDRTQSGAVTSYAVERAYSAAKSPLDGNEIERLLSDSQRQLLNAAGIRIDWTHIERIVEINATTWRTSAKSIYGKLALELWEWPAGKILEISARSVSAGDSAYAQLERLVKTKSLVFSQTQDTKTSVVLR